MYDFDFLMGNFDFDEDVVNSWQELGLYDCASSLFDSTVIMLSPIVSLFSPVLNVTVKCMCWYLEKLALAEDHVYGYEYVSNYVPKSE